MNKLHPKYPCRVIYDDMVFTSEFHAYVWDRACLLGILHIVIGLQKDLNPSMSVLEEYSAEIGLRIDKLSESDAITTRAAIYRNIKIMRYAKIAHHSDMIEDLWRQADDLPDNSITKEIYEKIKKEDFH